MYNISLEETLSIISKKTGLDRTTLMLKVQKKVQELSGLISMEGAAHVVANELGIELLDTSEKFIKIKDIIPGLRSISFSGMVRRVFPVYSFDKAERKGKVASIVVSDDTGEIRLVIWNHRVELIEKGSVKEGDVIEVHNVFVKEGKYGIEAHMRDKSKIEVTSSGLKPGVFDEKVPIARIEPDQRIMISGSLIDLFSKAFVFKSCPECKKKLDNENNCKEHGQVQPDYSFILNSVIDDGTGSIRCVFFGKQVEDILGMEKDEILRAENSGKDVISSLKSKLIGVEVEIFGKSRISSFDNRLEVIVSDSRLLEPKLEAKKLLENFEVG